MSLGLNQRTYLADTLVETLGGEYDHWWSLTEVVTEKQKSYILALCFNNKIDQLKTVIDDIENLQLTK